MIELPVLGAEDANIWTALLELSTRVPEQWTLIGGQMVLLHGLENGRQPPRVSQDLDLMVDARVRPRALPKVAQALADMDFELVEVTFDEIAHRFVRGAISIDVLAPEGTGKRTDLRLLGSIQVVQIRGGTAALGRSQPVEVAHRGLTGTVWRPDLLGALLVKSEAACHDSRRGPERHVTDLAFLYSMVADPLSIRAETSRKQRGTLRNVPELQRGDQQAWRSLGGGLGQDAFAAFELISRPD